MGDQTGEADVAKTPQQKWAALLAGMGVVGSGLGVFANLVGVVQLGHESPVIIALVLTAGVICFGVFLLAKRGWQTHNLWYWMANGALACATVMFLAAFITIATHSDIAQSTAASNPPASSVTPTTGNSGAAQVPPDATLLFQGTLSLAANQGVDLDSPHPQVVDAQTAAGDIDLALTTYFELPGSGAGLYHITGGSAASCRKTIDRHLEPAIMGLSIAGSEYCLRTSQGNVALIQIANTTVTDASTTVADKSDQLYISVWHG